MGEKAKTDYALLKKGGFMRQRQKDRFSLRLGVIGGTVTADQLEAIVAVARKYGEGYVHLTSRQGVEIPHVKLEDITAVKDALAKGGVAPGVCGPRVRTVTACQGSTVCPNGCIDAQDIAKGLHERYFGRELPHKFKFGVTGCVNNCLKAEENDVGVKGGVKVAWAEGRCIKCGLCEKVCRPGALKFVDGRVEIDRELCNFCGRCARSCPTAAYDTTSGYIVSFAGTFGNVISKGEPVVPFIESKEALYRVCDAAISFFAANAKPGERFKFTLDRVGREAFEKTIKEAVDE